MHYSSFDLLVLLDPMSARLCQCTRERRDSSLHSCPISTFWISSTWPPYDPSSHDPPPAGKKDSSATHDPRPALCPPRIPHATMYSPLALLRSLLTRSSTNGDEDGAPERVVRPGESDLSVSFDPHRRDPNGRAHPACLPSRYGTSYPFPSAPRMQVE